MAFRLEVQVTPHHKITMASDCERNLLARALWYTGRGCVEMRAAQLEPPGPGEAMVNALYSGVSRGTERLVLEGGIGDSEKERMRAPFQAGSFPFPVKYGYAITGRVDTGGGALEGRNVFCLHPHQDRFVAASDTLIALPDRVPARRATLAANMETALNALWDSGAGPGERITVVGAGVVGLLVTYLAARLPGAHVRVVDTNDGRCELVQAMGGRFIDAGQIEADADIVFHASASEAGLATAITAAGFEASIIEMSWYGDKPVNVPLGGAFHSQRLRLISSQVGHVATNRRGQWTHRRRLHKALELLADPILDKLVSESIQFDDAPRLLPGILRDKRSGAAPVICYNKSEPAES